MSVLSPMLFSFLNLNTCKAIWFNNWIRDLAEEEEKDEEEIQREWWGGNLRVFCVIQWKQLLIYLWFYLAQQIKPLINQRTLCLGHSQVA